MSREDVTFVYAKTPLLFDFRVLDLDLLDLFDELLFFFFFFFFSEPCLNLRCIMACRFLLLVNKIPMNMKIEPTNIAQPRVYFTLLLNEPEELDPKLRDR